MSEPNAVMFVRNYLIERDEALAPGEVDDDERMESAREIVEGVRKSLSATIPADVEGLVERLEKRGNSLNGASPVGAGDGNTYALGFYDQFAAKDDREAASALRSQAQRIGELERALDDARKTMRNARGAIESNQIEDKDVRRQLTQGIERIDAGRAALAKEGNGNG